MADPFELLVRDTLTADAIALHADAVRAEGRAAALASMPHGNPAGVRAEAARLRRAGEVALCLAGFDDAVLDALADGSIHRMLHEVRAAERRLKAIAGRR